MLQPKNLRFLCLTNLIKARCSAFANKKMKKICKICETKEFPILLKGICQKCFSLSTEKRLLERGEEIKFSALLLIDKYLIKKESIRKISVELNSSPFIIRKNLELLNIQIRKNTDSRNDFNENIFSKMSSQGAFLLGYIFTDGDLLFNENTKKYFLRIYSKHKEQIEKIKLILKTNAKIQKREQKNYGGVIQSEIYFLHIGNQIIINDLLNFGLTIKKNKNVKFPKLSEQFITHFIRGCWAGSGNVTIYKNKVYSSIVIGSFEFIKEIEKILNETGLKKRNIYKSKLSNNSSYLIKYAHGESEKLYNLLYKGKSNLTISPKQEKIYKDYFKRIDCN